MSVVNVLIALDQLVNTLAGGSPDETMSARAYRKCHKSTAWRATMNAIDFIFFWQDDHCYNSWRSEKERKQLPSEYR